MKAFFITTDTVDCANHVQAWNSFSPEPADHLTFKVNSIRNDWKWLQAVTKAQPDVIFYIGAVDGQGIPKPLTLASLNNVAPMIHLCSDAADSPWHQKLTKYDWHKCFRLQVAIDGGGNGGSYVGLSTLTPIDPVPFSFRATRDIRCGFSGSVGRWDKRSEVLNALDWFGGLTVRKRQKTEGYEEHGLFLIHCQMTINTSWTGTGARHHVKGRVLEAGWAGCALLEHEDSPIGDWFPKGCYFTWRDAKEAAEIIRDASDAEIESRAIQLAAKVRACFAPEMIYGEMLELVGLTL